MYKTFSNEGLWKYSDSNKTMSFKIIDKNLLKKYTKISKRLSNLMNTGNLKKFSR